MGAGSSLPGFFFLRQAHLFLSDLEIYIQIYTSMELIDGMAQL